MHALGIGQTDVGRTRLGVALLERLARRLSLGLDPTGAQGETSPASSATDELFWSGYEGQPPP